MTDIPGLTRGMSFADYVAIDAVNSHAIITGSQNTMRHMQAYRAGEMGREDSPDMRFGRAMHHRILEPDTFDASWPVATTCRAELGTGARKGQKCGAASSHCTQDGRFWFCGTHSRPVDAGKAGDFVTEDELSRIDAIVAEVHRAGQLQRFRRPGWSECVIEFEYVGIKCKARLDRLSMDGPVILDLKKCQVGKADQESFSRSVWDYGYHIQAAFYCIAVKQVTGDWPLFTWVIIEDKPPHCVNVIDASDFDLMAGRREIENILREWKRANESGEYHGHIRRNVTCAGGLPAWVAKRYSNEDLGESMLPATPAF